MPNVQPGSQPPAGWQPPAPSRPLLRYLAIGVTVLLALGVIGNVTGPSSDRPASTPLGSSGAAVSRQSTRPPSTVSPAAPTLGAAPEGETVEARVVRVIDGDTIVVESGGQQYHVRYIGMDAPEAAAKNKPAEWMSGEATQANAALVAGKTVFLERDVSETDRFDRLLRDVWLRDGSSWTLVNLEL